MAARSHYWGGYLRPRKRGSVKPPPGSYDPQLDQQGRAADRGLGYLTEDTGIGNSRDIVDYGLGVDAVTRNHRRSLTDLLTNRKRAGEDHTSALQGVARDFGRLANSQAQAQNAGNVLGGAIEQARQKRAANQQLAEAPINTAFARFNEDSGTAEARLNEDKGVSLGGLLTSLERNTADRGRGLTRATGENVHYHTDLNELRIRQAQDAGMLGYGSQHPSSRAVVNPRKFHVRQPGRKPTGFWGGYR